MTTGTDAPPRHANWTSPANALTLLRVALVPVIGLLLVVGREPGSPARWGAFAVFLLAAASDSVDGWVARRYQGTTRWGQLADPLADKALIVGSLSVLAWLRELPWLAVAVIVAREVAVTVQRAALLRRGIVMPASPYGKAKTVSQIVAVTLYLLPGAPRGLAVGSLVVAVVLTIASGLEYVARGRRLARAG